MRVGAVVVGYDGSPDSCAALDAALDHIAHGGIVHVVTVIDERTLVDVECMLRDAPPGLRPIRLHPDAVLRRAFDDALLLAASLGISHTGHLLDDPPGPPTRSVADPGAATALLEVARRVGADLIAVGCHGLGRDRSFARGSVATQVAHHAPRSVLMIRHHDSIATAAGPPGLR